MGHKRLLTRRRPKNDTRSIERRILDAMVYLIHVRRWKPKVIYLTEADRAQLQLRHQSYIDGIEVRIGKSSMLYATSYHGVWI